MPFECSYPLRKKDLTLNFLGASYFSHTLIYIKVIFIGYWGQTLDPIWRATQLLTLKAELLQVYFQGDSQN